MADDATRTAKTDAKFGQGFLTDIWYFAALSSDLKPGKLARHELLGEPVLLGIQLSATAPVLVDGTDAEFGAIGAGSTVKLCWLVAVPSAVATVIWPLCAFVGTVTYRFDVVLDTPTVACTLPPNFTTLADGVALNVLPEIVTAAPTSPLVGFTLSMLGSTMKVTPLEVPSAVVTVTRPVVAFTGTVTCSCVVLADVTVVCTPLNFTVLFAGVALNVVPVITTAVPTGP